ncbi:Nuclear receptor domain-containing protein [Caenorhabditis elegans]|uniref:Nuclear receptor domain-containing protein n=1 Tax=Caenorhabditis elegans TaxID=6239 RepID=G5EGP2_CAEEL|nr:Nuclear receptor domain-containing protein [Caenorhabditis elegans]NP_492921.2 Nuclear receptor domain-containing protein [Caenorhabditis elegans]CAA18369.1 Nuclear receptor domain-containing protein [Caenorhabditis elegans]CAB03927.2 Nuclear receptor domain-containing protein [Caenorhabditis elegans]|eukprot:NP_492921.2 Nuclear Hormone Receptor family [Caenorhabditis elegans]
MSTTVGRPSNEIASCQVCHSTERTRLYFGITSCAACAAFFRRSDGIRYMCTATNSCTISHDMKFFCRACRYTSCIRAGMVMSRNALATARKAPNNIIPREPTPRSVPSLEEVDGFSKILNISNGDLLKYYVKEVESIMAQQRYGEQKNALQVKSVNDLMIVTAYQEGTSLESCFNCPGVDILYNEDVEVVHKYFKFSNTWIDSLLAPTSPLDPSCNERISEFIHLLKSTLGSTLAQLNLNIIEYAAFKSFCIWKLVYHKTSISMKIVAQEHYEGVTSALRKYYRKNIKMSELEMATRIGDITLQIITVSNLYNDMARMYHQTGLQL